jgi:lipoate-protein ligase A
MICIDKQSLDPWFNLAADEFVLKNLAEDVFMLWQNTECIVYGKHQLPLQEFDLQLVEHENIPVIRRISGGGTVYHGPGNVNFSFVTTESVDKINFGKYLLPIQLYLKEIGMNAEVLSKSNLVIHGLKISGNAASVHRNRSLHHGTLLFETDKSRLDFVLQKPKQTYHTKAVISNRVETTNISKYLMHTLSFEEFCNGLQTFVNQYFGVSEIRSFTAAEIGEISKLSNEKFKSREWNFGYSPDYSIESEVFFSGEKINISLHVKQGRIDSVILSNEQLSENIEILKEALIGIPHDRNSVSKRLIQVRDRLTCDDIEFKSLINNIL